MPTITRDGAPLYYEVHGTGHPVFFIHGGGGNTLAWYQQIPYFKDKYKCIPVDLRGFKNSTWPAEQFHPKYYPDDMRAIMDAEGIKTAAFVCQSLGAWAGLPIAVYTPERVSCLFMNGSPTPAYSAENWKLMERANPIFMSKEFSRGEGVGWNRETLKTRPELVFLYSQIKQLNPPGLNPLKMQADEVKIHPEHLNGYKVPTMLCGGAHDDFLIPGSHIHSASLIPGCSTYTFPNSGHSAYFEQAEQFNKVAAEFLARHVPT